MVQTEQACFHVRSSLGGCLWVRKTVTTEKAANSAMRSGLKQIRNNPGGTMLNYGERRFDLAKLIGLIEKRMGWYPEDTADYKAAEAVVCDPHR